MDIFPNDSLNPTKRSIEESPMVLACIAHRKHVLGPGLFEISQISGANNNINLFLLLLI